MTEDEEEAQFPLILGTFLSTDNDTRQEARVCTKYTEEIDIKIYGLTDNICVDFFK